MDPLSVSDLLLLIGDKEVRLVQQQRYIHALTAEIERLKAALVQAQKTDG